MNIICLFKWFVPGFNEVHENWSLKDWCGADFSELIKIKYFYIPEGYKVSDDLTGIPHFYGKLYGSNSTSWFDVETDKNGNPFIFNGQKIYLEELKKVFINKKKCDQYEENESLIEDPKELFDLIKKYTSAPYPMGNNSDWDGAQIAEVYEAENHDIFRGYIINW